MNSETQIINTMKEISANSVKLEQTMMSHQMKLISGKFEAHEAQDILINLINHKIQHHEVKNLSSVIRNGHDDEGSQKRLKELRSDRERVNEIIEVVKANGSKLKIEASITIREEQ